MREGLRMILQGSIQSERGKDCMNIIKELLFPRRCPVCDEIVKRGSVGRGIGTGHGKNGSQPTGQHGNNRWRGKICPQCVEKLVPVRQPWCLKCGKPLRREAQEYCRDCSRGRHFFTCGRAVFTYDSAAASLYRFKYGERQEYAECYGALAAEILADDVKLRQAEAIVPVPLHPARQRKRGYNQAALFAEALGEAWGIPVQDKLVVRCRNTKPLKQLNPLQRQNNLKKAFKIIQNDVKLNTIIIVDDIYTTGSTMDAVAKVFSEAGVHKIYFVTLAVGNGF